jgi:hypothetical protein
MKKTMKKKPTERYADMLESDTFINIRLTTDELLKLNALARARREFARVSVYPLILHYLNDCAQPVDKPIVIRAIEVAKDKHWGTEDELTNPRQLPEFFKKGTEDRNRVTQQLLGERAYLHLQRIGEYYRVTREDLVASAIEWNFKKLGL